jgi:hypothetical protein
VSRRRTHRETSPVGRQTADGPTSDPLLPQSSYFAGRCAPTRVKVLVGTNAPSPGYQTIMPARENEILAVGCSLEWLKRPDKQAPHAQVCPVD